MLLADELPLREGGLLSLRDMLVTLLGYRLGVVQSLSRLPFSLGSECSPFACGDMVFCFRNMQIMNTHTYLRTSMLYRGYTEITIIECKDDNGKGDEAEKKLKFNKKLHV